MLIRAATATVCLSLPRFRHEPVGKTKIVMKNNVSLAGPLES